MPLPKKNRLDLIKHAKKRCLNRYGDWLEDNDYERLVRLVQDGKGIVLMKESKTLTHFLLEDKYIVVYNKALHAIVTFLPPEAIHGYLKQTP